MQHRVLIQEDVAGADPIPTQARTQRPGHDAPYAGYRLGAAYDEMFAADGRSARLMPR